MPYKISPIKSIEKSGGVAVHVNRQFAKRGLPFTYEANVLPYFVKDIHVTTIRTLLDNSFSRHTITKWKRVYSAEQSKIQAVAARKEFSDNETTQ